MTDRRLAAIVFTDIVGYTALMGADEDRAFEVLGKNREIHNNLIDKFNGTLIKEMGDGMLISFNLASDAVRCAIEIQKACKQQDIPLKIGIHEGEMVFEGADVLGDGVNVASRLQDSTKEGCITISGSVYRDIKNKPAINAKFVGEKSFKNVDEPIKVYKVFCEGEIKEEKSSVNGEPKKSSRRLLYYAIAGLISVIFAFLIWQFMPTGETGHSSPEASIDQEISIAVLPFDNMSGDPDQEAMCDGLTEEIIHHLSTINLFDKVISLSSVMTFKDSEKTTPEIAGMLNVNLILGGSYRQSGNRLRITAELIEASSDKQLWSELYERPTGDIFDIQSEIAKNIAFNLKGELTSGDSTQFNIARTENIKAFELYQLGRFYWNQRTGEGYQRSIEYFQQTIDEDPEYGLAYAGLADTYNLMALQGHIDQTEGRDKAVDLSKKALELDDQLAEAHNVLASIYTYIDRDWESADQEYLKAIEINPNYPTVHQYYSEYLSFMGNHEEARKQVNKAIELDPLSFVIRYESMMLNFNQGQFQEALLDLERCRELNHGKDHSWIAKYYFRINRELGNEQAAFDGIKRWYGDFLSVIEPKEMDSIYQISGIDGILKRRIESTDYLGEKTSLYGILGNDEKALEWLEIAVEKGEEPADFPFLYEFRNLHSNPRYQALLRKIGLGDI